MNQEQITNIKGAEFGELSPELFLMGLLSGYGNRSQAYADKAIPEITWKQFFAIECIRLFQEDPTINELSHVMGSSHQNVKQILNKLEAKGFVHMVTDNRDRRKQRIAITDSCRAFYDSNEQQNLEMVGGLLKGVDDEQLSMTIQTISKMKKNITNI